MYTEIVMTYQSKKWYFKSELRWFNDLWVQFKIIHHYDFNVNELIIILNCITSNSDTIHNAEYAISALMLLTALWYLMCEINKLLIHIMLNNAVMQDCLHKFVFICIRYAVYMHYICTIYALDMLYICTMYARYMHYILTCLLYTSDAADE